MLTGWLDTEREATPFGLVPKIEAWIDKDAKRYHLRLALPGVDPNKVDLKLQGKMLTISAEFNNGLLEITAPVAAAALPLRVDQEPAQGQGCVKNRFAIFSPSRTVSGFFIARAAVIGRIAAHTYP